MKDINLKEKVFLAVFGIITALILLETGLSLLSYFTVDFSKGVKIPYSFNNESIKILCLGDSFTYGLGAGFDKSYPAQMEDILKQTTGKEINVINGGISSANSAIVLGRLKLFLKRIKPDVVIVMTGSSDSWNFKEVQNKFGWTISLRNFFSNSRVSQLISIIFHNLRFDTVKNQYLVYMANQKTNLENERIINRFIEEANLLRSRGLYQQAIEKYKEALKLNPYHRLTLLEMARNYKLKKDYDKSLNILEFSLSINPQDIQIWQEINDIFIKQSDFKKSINFYSRMLNFHPVSKIAKKQLVQSYIHLGDEYYQKRDYKKVASCYQRAMAISPEDATIYNRIYYNKTVQYYDSLWYGRKRAEFVKKRNRDAQRELIDKITEDNLREIARLCKKKGILLIFSSYPEKMSEVIFLVAQEYNIPFVDQRPVFTSIEVRNKQEEYFAKDRHCTAKGYRLVAENIAKEILDRLDSDYKFK